MARKKSTARVKAKPGRAPTSRGSAAPAAPPVTFPLRVAAIDVGSSAIRFFAAEFLSPARFSPLVSERVPVRMGHGVFLTGRLTQTAMDAAVAAIERFQEQMDQLGVARHRAIATSAVRESRNGEEFIRRVREETGVDLQVVTGSEEARLFYLAVKNRVPLSRDGMLLVDLGGGSVEVALVDDSGIQWIESHTMGSVRLLEELTGSGDEPGRFSRLLQEYVRTLRLPSFPSGRKPAGFIATGGNIEALAKLAGAVPRVDGVSILPLNDLQRAIGTLSRLSYRQRITQLGLKEDRADIILPAALVYERLASLAGAREILVPFVAIKEGIVLDLVDDLTTHQAHADRQDQLTFEGAVALGRRYLFDEAHGVHVAKLARTLFDQLRKLHGLSGADRRILTAAAVLHDIGSFVSTKRHHKHTWYLVSQSELPGFTPREIEVVANVARYHRKGEPAPHHEPFVKLTYAEQDRVAKLASMLRVADALDREHLQRVTELRAVSRRRDEVTLQVRGAGDLLLEKWALQKKAQLFQKTMGVKLLVRALAEP